RRGLAVIPGAAAAVAVCIVHADLVAPGELRPGSGARRIFPLRFAEQPVGLAGHAREPRDETPGIVEIDVDHRLPTAPPAAVADPRIAVAVGDAGVPLVERHLELRHGEGPGEDDLVRRALVGIVSRFTGLRSHHELAGWQHHHLGTVFGAFAE